MSDAVDGLVAATEHARSRVLAFVAGLSEAQAAFKPADGGWSINEVLEHLYLAEMSGVSKICSAVESVRAGGTWTQPLPNAGKHIEQIVSETWKTQEAAPPIATPHIGGPLWYWTAIFRTLTPVLADLRQRLRGLRLEDIVFPHFLSGPMDAAQRLEFLRWHMERHLAQMERVRSSPGFPA
jgi:hypothetical protein